MTDITNSNFQSTLHRIVEDLNSCAFISIDAEFTGLIVNGKYKTSLFDDPAKYYDKLRHLVSEITVVQFGLALFIYDEGKNEYQASTYNFYLYPRSAGPVDVKFNVQASCFEFLTKYGFDFNKFIYEGISFINNVQERCLRECLENDQFNYGFARDVDDDVLQSLCSNVADWLAKSTPGDQIVIDRQGIPSYALCAELHYRFTQVWAMEHEKGVKVRFVKEEERQTLSTEFKKVQLHKTMSIMLGFTQVFREIVAAKKPIFGHNCFLDLLLMYDKFYEPLPPTYSDYKAEIHRLFPLVFDTKHIVTNMHREIQRKTSLLKCSGLNNLYQNLDSKDGKFFVLCTPVIKHADGFDKYRSSDSIHEAGFDAYITGYVFLRMTHLKLLIDVSSIHAQPQSFNSLLNSVMKYKNRVNLIRAAMHHANLEGDDVPTHRPQWLYVRAKCKDHELKAIELAKLFAKFDSVNVHIMDNRQALLAVSSHRGVERILRQFHHHSDLLVIRYQWHHSPHIRKAMWCGVGVLGGLWCLCLYNGLLKRG